MRFHGFLLVVLAFLGTIFLIDLLFSPMPTWADYIFSQYDKRKDSTDVILIGNSHTGAIKGIRIGDWRLMNFSIAGIELKERLTVLRHVVQQKGSLKFVIMSMDYDQVGHKPSDTYIGNMLLPYEIQNSRGFRRILKMLLPINFLKHNRDFSKLYEYHTKGIDFSKQVNVVPLSFKDRHDGVACRKRALELSTLDFSGDRVGDNFRILEEIDSLLKEAHVQLIFLNTPKTRCFTQAYNASFNTSYYKKLKEFAAGRNIPFLDFGSDERFDENDFRDFDHLNLTGSRKICEYIRGFL
jgi:hypothetical protein